MRRKIISLIYLWILSCLPIIAQIGGQVNIDINELKEVLANAGYTYYEDINQFR